MANNATFFEAALVPVPNHVPQYAWEVADYQCIIQKREECAVNSSEQDHSLL